MTIEPITFIAKSPGDDARVLTRIVGNAVGLAWSLRKR